MCRYLITCHNYKTASASQVLSFLPKFQILCCASYVLSQEADFLEQEEWLAEVVKKAGFNILFYPKCHCELNYIELVWGWTKSYHRRTCTYNYKDLKRDLPKTLSETWPIADFKRFFRYCLRFMSGHREGLEGPLLDYTSIEVIAVYRQDLKYKT